MEKNPVCRKLILIVDLGTTTVRSIIYTEDFVCIGSSYKQIELLYPEPGHVEIDAEKLFQSILTIVEEALKDGKITAADINCFGLTTQRSTFITWDKRTGKLFQNLNTWKDVRADYVVQSWNKGFTFKVIHFFSNCLYFVTRHKRYLAGSVLKLLNTMVTPRLIWMLNHNEELKEALKNNTAYFGTLESWLLFKLRLGRHITGEPIMKDIEHISDISNCSATGFYDPFTRTWADWAIKLFSFKKEMLPKVVSNDYDFGFVCESFFGSKIKISTVVGDQTAAMFGNCCFDKGNVKVTMGTGSFLNINSGNECHASVQGLYPLLSWSIGNEFVYSVEGASNDTGSIIKWANTFLFDNPSETSDLAYSVDSSDGVFFVPAFSGLGAPINNISAATGFIGITPETSKSHMVRAILESIIFRVAQLYLASLRETNFEYSVIRVDGGVSRNDFVCQSLADICGISVERSTTSEMTAIGTAYLCALNSKWKSKEELRGLYIREKLFEPIKANKQEIKDQMERWEDAISRFKSWY